ncbi:MAG: hypothetical protein ACYC8T_31050 [Myxococcaceae bacterium]
MRAAALVLAVSASANAGELLSLGDMVAAADLIVEVKVPVKAGAPVLEKTTVERVVAPAGGAAPAALPSVLVFSSGSPCWKAARGSVKTLVFLKAQGDGALRQLAGVEVESGRYSDLHPAYPLLVAAAAESATSNG